VWVVGTNPLPGGYGIYEWTGSGWKAAPGAAVTIAVDPSGRPWVINSADQIYHWSGSGWGRFPGSAMDIAVGANGAVWVVGTNPLPGGYGIYEWTGTGWAGVLGAGVTIAADASGYASILDSIHEILAS